MYDLPSEFPEEPGLPDVGVSPSRDVFHDLQPQLLSRTLSLVDYSRDNWFTGADLNIYYDSTHPFEGIPSCWLRWFDKAGNWLLTDTE